MATYSVSAITMTYSLSRGRPPVRKHEPGEQGGDPASIAFCHEVGMNYVSCAPGRIPVARLSAAQAALGHTPTDR